MLSLTSSPQFARAGRAALRALALVLLVSATARCYRAQCVLNSDCDRATCESGACVFECRADIDCPAGRSTCNLLGRCVASSPDAGGPDAGPDGQSADVGSMDSRPPRDDGPDVPEPRPDVPEPRPDVPEPRPDVPVAGTGAYLDPCAADGECAGAACTSASPRFCTRSCAAHGDCADGQICVAGRCAADDAGRSGCDPTTASPCGEFCVGTPRATHCTHACATATECPAGYACVAAGGRRVCVDIERPCSTADECPSGLGFCGAGGVGCTALCASAADCPARLVGLPPYTCEDRSGQRVCVPPADVLGADALGATCSATGTNTCRSGACDDGTAPPTCNQRCTPRGGCPAGYGCFPLASGGEILLVCTVAGTRGLGDTCGRARDCVSGLCDTGGYCTRLCVDGFCPTGMRCTATGLTANDGTSIRICRR